MQVGIMTVVIADYTSFGIISCGLPPLFFSFSDLTLVQTIANSSSMLLKLPVTRKGSTFHCLKSEAFWSLHIGKRMSKLAQK